MGGKNPSVVLADANLPFAVEQVARGAFLSAGQKCTATSRVIVEESAVEEFQERLATLARSWKLGDPLEEDTKVGPVVSKDQLQTVLDYIQLGEKEGGHFVTGGKQATELGDGYYVQPTVITDLGRDSRVAREEIFGPVAAIIPVRSYEEAVALANDTPFGLTASLFTNDLTKALRFVNDIRVGVVKINQESAGLEYQVPFGGAKESSSGSREQGQAAKEFFTQWKTVYMDQLPMG
jgi:aldehyde dehydrogenase (NAD+)